MSGTKGTPTDLNLSVLRWHFGTADEAPNAIERVSAPHMRRCLKAGLFEVRGRVLVLTDAGRKALGRTS